MMPLDQGLKVILLEDAKEWPLEETPTHLHRLFSNRKGDEVAHLLCLRKQVNAKMEKKVKKRHGKTWKQPKCPSTGEWIKMWHIYTMEYYTAIKENEIMPLQKHGWT